MQQGLTEDLEDGLERRDGQVDWVSRLVIRGELVYIRLNITSNRTHNFPVSTRIGGRPGNTQANSREREPHDATSGAFERKLVA